MIDLIDGNTVLLLVVVFWGFNFGEWWGVEIGVEEGEDTWNMGRRDEFLGELGLDLFVGRSSEIERDEGVLFSIVDNENVEL